MPHRPYRTALHYVNIQKDKTAHLYRPNKATAGSFWHSRFTSRLCFPRAELPRSRTHHCDFGQVDFAVLPEKQEHIFPPCHHQSHTKVGWTVTTELNIEKPKGRPFPTHWSILVDDDGITRFCYGAAEADSPGCESGFNPIST